MTRGPDGEPEPEPTFADVMNAFSFDSGRKAKRRRWGRSGEEDDPAAQPDVDQDERTDVEPADLDRGWPMSDHRRTDYDTAGHRPAEYDVAGHRPAEYDVAGHRPAEYEVAGHRPAEHEMAGHRPADYDVAERGFAGYGVGPAYDDPDDAPAGPTSVRPYAWTRGRTRSGYALEIETLVSTSPRGREQLALLQVEHRAVAELCRQVRSVAEVAALLRLPLGVAKVVVGDMAGLGLVAVHESVSANGDVPDFALMERVLSGLRRL